MRKYLFSKKVLPMTLAAVMALCPVQALAGGENTIYMHNTKVHGKTVLDKAGVRLHMTGHTNVPDVEMKAPASLTADKTFTGEVGTVKIIDGVGTSEKITIDAPTDKIFIDGKASMVINAPVKIIEISENAANTKVEIAKGVTVDKIVVDAKVTLSGTGTVEALEVNVDGVTVNKNLTVKDTDVAEGVKAPAVTTETTAGGGGGGSSSSKKDRVTASVEDTITAVIGEGWSEPVPVTLKGAAYKTIENVTWEEFEELKSKLREELTVEYPDGIEVGAYPRFAEKYDTTNWETTDVEFTVVVGARAYEDTEPGDYTYTVTISPELLDFENGYKHTSVEATGKVTVVQPEVIDTIYIEMEKAPVFTTTTTTDEFGTTGVEFTIDYDGLFVYTLDKATNTINDEALKKPGSLEYIRNGYCVWNENDYGKNTSAEYTLTIEAEAAKGFTFGEGIDIKLCEGVSTGVHKVTEFDSQIVKIDVTFTVTVEDLEELVNAKG